MPTDGQIEDWFKDIFHPIFAPFLKQNEELINREMELAAIWLIGNPIIAPDGTRKCRIQEGDKISIEGDKIVFGDTFTIMGCFGTISDKEHRILLKSNITDELIIHKI